MLLFLHVAQTGSEYQGFNFFMELKWGGNIVARLYQSLCRAQPAVTTTSLCLSMGPIDVVMQLVSSHQKRPADMKLSAFAFSAGCSICIVSPSQKLNCELHNKNWRMNQQRLYPQKGRTYSKIERSWHRNSTVSVAIRHLKGHRGESVHDTLLQLATSLEKLEYKFGTQWP